MLKKSMLILVAISGLFGCTDSEESVKNKPIDQQLEKAILDCEDITEKAAAHLVAVVDFQKLEIAGRKAHVFKQCMHDRGYIESQSWLDYSKPLANQTAQQTQISIDEALENLRRTNMKSAVGENKRPAYWVQQK